MTFTPVTLEEARTAKAYLRRDPCAYCGAIVAPNPATIDHIVPRSGGGEDEWFNFTAACASCNSRKSDRPLLMFLLMPRRMARPPRDVGADFTVSRRALDRIHRGAPEGRGAACRSLYMAYVEMNSGGGFPRHGLGKAERKRAHATLEMLGLVRVNEHDGVDVIL